MELQPGGQITGVVTGANSHDPLEGVEVCASQRDAEEFGISCRRTDALGEYEISGLPTASYVVSFRASETLNYVSQYFDDKPLPQQAEEVPVVAGGAPASEIDAAMSPGVEITGRITEAGTGNPIPLTQVCAQDPFSQKDVGCWFADGEGNYAIKGLPPVRYVVGFSIAREEEGVVVGPDDGYVRQYYDHKAAFGEATQVGSPAPGIYPGIDAALSKGPEVFPSRYVTPPSLPTIGRGPAPKPTPDTPLPLKTHCRSGFRKQTVKGRTHCVKKHHKHRHHPRGHGGHRSPAAH
jgi:hypothetical protein